jgi:LysR family transcriptional regulator, hydrogen peroxide-inducible genes activator
MNLSQLEYTSAVAAVSSFTKAAQACAVTQPTLSNAIAQFEDELGERIFARTTRSVTLTSFGAHILPYVREVLRASASLTQQTQAFLRPDKQLVRIGTSPLVNAAWLGLIIEPFANQYPGVDFVFREMNMDDLYRALQESLIDFIFGVDDPRANGWARSFLYREPLLFLPRGSKLPKVNRRQGVDLRDIADETFVMVPDACGLARTTRALFRTHRRKLKAYSGEAMSYQALEQWATLGVGAALLPRSKISEKKRPSYSVFDRTGDELSISFAANWSPHRARPPHLRAFASHLRKTAPGVIAGLIGSPTTALPA